MWVSVGAAVVAIAALALVFREQPPYDFLRDAEYVRTEVYYDPFYSNRALVTYETRDDISSEARDELLRNGWSEDGGRFLAPGPTTWHIEFYWTETVSEFATGPTQGHAVPHRYYVQIRRLPTIADRFNAWLDRVTGR